MESPVQFRTGETPPGWTDEKHLHFLSCIEASFVRAMLHGGNGRSAHLRLDRHLPDSSESTLDLKPHRRRAVKQAPSDSMGPRARMENRRTKRRSSQPYNSSKDQVVPQLEDGREGARIGDHDNDKEQRSNV